MDGDIYLEHLFIELQSITIILLALDPTVITLDSVVNEENVFFCQ